MTAHRSLIAIVFSACIAVAGGSTGAFAQYGYNTPASRYFAGRKAITMPAQPIHRPAPTPQPMNITGGQKPFENIQRPNTISPYLSLDIVVSEDDDESLPNYYAFYRPQREQQQAIESQQAEIRRLQQQVRVANAKNEISRKVAPGMPTTGSSSQFMNLGSYYPGLR